MLRLARMPANPKNWRPTVLVLVGNPQKQHTIAMYALWMGAERGLVILARVIIGELDELAKLRKVAVDQLDGFSDEKQFEALSTVVVCQNIDEGLAVLLQGNPVGPLKPNIVMMEWPADMDNATSFVNHLNSPKLLGMSLILLKDEGLPKSRVNRRIDVWWRGRENGSLMVLLAHLMTLNWEWSNAKIRMLRLIQDEAGREPATQALHELVNAARVDAEAPQG